MRSCSIVSLWIWLGPSNMQSPLCIIALLSPKVACADFDKLLPSTDIVITTPFWPAYLTKDRLLKAKQLELSLTAGVGSDHVDLHTAAQKGITVAEVKKQ